MNHLKHVGKYFIMLGQVFKKPQNLRVFKEALFKEFDELGLKSLGIVIFISFFIGGVIALQTALNIENPFIFINKNNELLGMQAIANPWTSVRFRYAPPRYPLNFLGLVLFSGEKALGFQQIS